MRYIRFKYEWEASKHIRRNTPSRLCTSHIGALGRPSCMEFICYGREIINKIVTEILSGTCTRHDTLSNCNNTAHQWRSEYHKGLFFILTYPGKTRGDEQMIPALPAPWINPGTCSMPGECFYHYTTGSRIRTLTTRPYTLIHYTHRCRTLLPLCTVCSVMCISFGHQTLPNHSGNVYDFEWCTVVV